MWGGGGELLESKIHETITTMTTSNLNHDIIYMHNKNPYINPVIQSSCILKRAKHVLLIWLCKWKACHQLICKECGMLLFNSFATYEIMAHSINLQRMWHDLLKYPYFN